MEKNSQKLSARVISELRKSTLLGMTFRFLIWNRALLMSYS